MTIQTLTTEAGSKPFIIGKKESDWSFWSKKIVPKRPFHLSGKQL
jgi:hypothetical protein